MRVFVKRVVNWFLAVGIGFPLLTLLIGKTIFPKILELEFTFLFWPKSEFVLKNVVHSTEVNYPPDEIMKFYGLAILSNAILYLLLGAITGVVIWLVRRACGK